MLRMSQAGVRAWSVFEARGAVEPPQYSVCILCQHENPFGDNFFDFLRDDVLAGGNLHIHQGCMWDEDDLDVRSEELDLRGQQNGRQSDEHEFGERGRAVGRFP